jgi:hypothetical protein
MQDDISGEWWDATLHAMEAIIDCLPLETQRRIVDRLHLLARVQEDRDLWVASYFSRALSGEKAPPPGEVAQPLGYDAQVERMLTDDYDFRDQLRHQQHARSAEGRSRPAGLFSAFIKPEDGIALSLNDQLHQA